MLFAGCMVVTFAAGAACMDLSNQKIANGWIAICFLTGLFYQFMLDGFTGMAYGLVGAVLPVLILFPMFCFRMLGPGDIKLFAALGTIMGVRSVFICILYSVVFGGILSLGFLIICGNLTSRLTYFTQYISRWIQTKKTAPYYRVGHQVENLHFSVPILMSVMLYAGGFF